MCGLEAMSVVIVRPLLARQLRNRGKRAVNFNRVAFPDFSAASFEVVVVLLNALAFALQKSRILTKALAFDKSDA
jgi:hypothetical protein